MKSIFFFCIILSVVHGQTSESPVAILFNLRIGKVLDSLERKAFYPYFLPAVKGFSEARLLQVSGSAFILEVHYWKDGSYNTMNINRNLEETKALLEYFGGPMSALVDAPAAKIPSVKIRRNTELSAWVNLGLGGGGSLSGYGGNGGGGLCLSFQVNRIIATARAITLVGILASPPEFNEYGFLCNWSSKSRSFLKSAGLGIGFVNVTNNYPNEGSAVGLAVDGQLFFRPTSFAGIGLYIFGNINTRFPFSGALFCLQFGKLR